MKKFRCLKLFGLVCMLVFSIFVTGTTLVLSGGKGKPPKWKAVILETTDGNLIGVDGFRYIDNKGWEYDDIENDVTVYATIGKPYRTIFRFITNYPVQIGFQAVPQMEYYVDPDLNFCGFPSTFPCLFDFLNDVHPWDEQYLRIQFGFYGPFVSSRDEADWEKMAIGEEREMRAWISLEANNLYGDCSECNTENYHSFEMNTHDASLIRDSEDTWRVVVYTDFDNPDYLANGGPPFNFGYTSDFIREVYCECLEVKPSKGKRPPTYRKEKRYPAWGRGHIQFEIEFTTANN